ncbi:MAG TPA: glycoside hydrolase family 2 TIM barrel-domain containing protein, partial [Rhodothermia bacterium]|nr:glycoside hydrolase family 2 TIM barrel-domain containing protein [Rhodothermia bacterium]
GKPIRLNGTNRHQDYPGFGNAVPDWVHRKDVAIVKDNGFNFLRLAHYPQDPVVLEETDRLGLVVWEEIPIVNIITMSDTFDRNSETMLIEMIRQHYNHPSIFMWGYMNEVMLREPRPVPEGYYVRLLALTKHLESVLKKEDPSRISVMAQSVGEVYNGKGLSEVTDILGMNLYFGWYYDDFDTLGVFLDRLHRDHPDRPLLVSEYGAGHDERVHTREPVAFDFSSEHAQNFHLASFEILNQRPYVVGSAVWNQFDFGSEGRQDTKNAINQKGLYFHDRTPKDIAYYYRAALLDEPVLHIANEWSRRAGSRPEDAVQPVWVYSNAEEVELTVNGRPVSVRKAANRRAEWTVRLNDGANRIGALAPGDGDVMMHDAVIEYDDRTSLFGSGVRPGDLLAVNAGANYQFIGRDGVVWEEDREYEPGSWGYVGGRARRVHNRILGVDDDPLYQATRDGADRYKFDVVDGVYEVEIRMAETDKESDRTAFDVVANGESVWSDVDLAGTVGRFAAVSRRVVLDVRSGEGLAVTFEPAAASTVAGILVRRE